MSLRSLGLALSTALMLSVPAGSGSAGAEDDAIRAVLMAAFDRPDQRLVVEPVVVAGDHAVADWSQGATGGRALLRRAVHGAIEGAIDGWIIVLCSGEEIRSADALVRTGIPRPAAAQLAAALAEAERHVAAERLALFATFEGTVPVEEGAHHR